jgi:hypothetical protein
MISFLNTDLYIFVPFSMIRKKMLIILGKESVKFNLNGKNRRIRLEFQNLFKLIKTHSMG